MKNIYPAAALKTLLAAALLAAAASVTAADTPAAPPIPSSFDAAGPERAAILELLANYTKAVSSKDQPLFESLLLNKAIPFSYVPDGPGAHLASIANYEDFRRGVFEGRPFTQRFSDVHIQSDGNLAVASLVFVNTDGHGETWGWKTLHLLRTAGGWKIASEFFTIHR